MPARPRLAKVSTPARATAKPSMSRMGREEEIKSAVPTGIAAPISRATSCSDQVEISATSFIARSEYFFHFSAYSASGVCTSRAGNWVNFCEALRSESTVAKRGSITMTFLARAMSALIERERVVRPTTTTVSGARSSEIVFEVKKTLACEIAPSKVRGSSEITGQPSSFEKARTDSALKPPRSCPITRIPRVDLV